MKKKSILMLAIMAASLYGGEMRLRFGVMTDTHIGKKEESLALVRKAFELFKQENVDLIVHCGDVADKHCPPGYRLYRKLFNEVFPAQPPRELFVYAYHDMMGMPDMDSAFEAMEREIGAGNKPYSQTEIKGYTFLTFPQKTDYKRYEKTIAAAIAQAPDKPLFLLDHAPPFDTVADSGVWGNARLNPILDKFPQVIQFSGHVHGSVQDERNIWQGNYTAISAGCLKTWAGRLVGSIPTRKSSDGVLIAEVYTDRVDVRRFSVSNAKEYTRMPLWSVPLPFEAATAPYSLKMRQSTGTVPQFAPTATLELSAQKDAFDHLTVHFPCALPAEDVYIYHFEICRKNSANEWQPFVRQNIFSNFYLDDDHLHENYTHTLSAGHFEDDQEYLISVAPESFFEVSGKALTLPFKAPAKHPHTILLESSSPMEQLPFKIGLAGGSQIQQEQGFYLNKASRARLTFPGVSWQAPLKTRFRLTIEMELIQPHERSWTMTVCNPDPMRTAHDRIATATGTSGRQRYVMEFTHRHPDNEYCLLFREGSSGKIRFNYVKIEQLDNVHED